MTSGPGDLLLRLDADTRGLEAGLARANSAVLRHETSLRSSLSAAADLDKMIDRDLTASAHRQAAAFDKAGTALLGFGAVAAAGLGLAAREAVQWESAWAGVTKTVDGSVEQMAELESGLRDLALILPASHEEIAAVAEAAGALGVQRGAILGFTKTMIDLGETTDLSAEQAATAIAQIATVMGTDLTTEVSKFGNVLVELGNNGASTESQILDLASRIAGAGALIGLSEADVLAYASALTSMGIEAEAGGTAISQVFSSIAKEVATGGDGLDQFATIAGLSAEEFAAAFRTGPAEATQLVIDGLARLSAGGENVFGILDSLGFSGERVGRVLLSAAGASEELNEALALAGDEWANGNALQEEAAKRYETTESKIQLTKNALSDAGIEIGQQLLPILSTLATTLSDVIGWFSDLPGPVKMALTGLAGLAAVGGIGVGAMLKLQQATSRFLDTMDAAPGVVKATTTSMKALGAVSIVAGLAVLAYTFKDLAGLVKDLDIDTGKLATGLYVLAQTGEDTAGVASTLGTSFDEFSAALGTLDPARDYDDLNTLVQQLGAVGSTLTDMVNAGDAEQAAELVRLMGYSAKEAAEIFPSYAAALEESGVRAEDLAAEQQALLDSTDDLTPAQQALADEFGLTGQEARDAADDLARLDDELSNIFDTMFSSEEAQDRLTESMLELTTQIQEANAAVAAGVEGAVPWDFALDGNSAAALRNRDSVRDMINENLELIGTWDRTKLSSAELDTQIDDLKQAFIDHMVQSGYSQEAVERYAAAFDLVPREVPSEFTQPGMTDALGNTLTLHQRLQDLEGTTVHTVQVVFDVQEWGGPDFGGGGYMGGGRIGAPPGGQGAGGQSYQEQGAGAGTYSMPGGGQGRVGGGFAGQSGQVAGATLNITNNFRTGASEALVISAEAREAALLARFG